MDGQKEKLKREKYIELYMDLAFRISKMSYAKRLQVGSILVKDNNIISFGWNGTPSGWDNVCEDDNFQTKSEVLHSEQNLLMKVARSTNSTEDSIAFITHAPCIQCSKLLYQAGVKEVYYRNPYRCTDGIEFLKKCNIGVFNV